ncbi:hypothetical protein PVAND_017539 [Polypedilum vanderplanki]|uniref:Uncharacterized protein n=1 Tax=Polypedilum vanderplanki TaxID=319348 RepID=A0A9J6BJC1_POLVA|nr:hypothetical protein PVAND_017539 [Polypedilum vanderplanki]
MNYHWIPSTVHQAMPAGGNAVYAGNDSDGSPIYVGRAYHEGENLPAKIIPSKQSCYVPYNGLEIFQSHFEYLSGSGFTWVQSSNGHVPAGAVSTGNTANHEPLYIGRAHHEGSLTPGKVHRSHGCLYLPYGGAEQSTLYYEVLVCKQKSEWVSTTAHSPLPANAIHAGNDSDGTAIYVGRCYHESDLLPAKVLPSRNVAYVSYGGQEIPKYSYDVLCGGNVQWIPSSNGVAHSNAVVGGNTGSGETLYIGRAHYQGSVTPGKIHPSHSVLYIPYGGLEVAIPNYEVLVEY